MDHKLSTLFLRLAVVFILLGVCLGYWMGMTHNFTLSPVQAGGSDPVVKTTSWSSSTGSISIPGRTVAVLLQP